jgi:hypothetical protein
MSLTFFFLDPFKPLSPSTIDLVSSLILLKFSSYAPVIIFSTETLKGGGQQYERYKGRISYRYIERGGEKDRVYIQSIT